MRVKYTKFTGQHSYQVDESLEDFAVNQLLTEEVHGYDEKVRLERQPGNIARAVGRLLELLYDKGVIDGSDIHKALDSRWPAQDGV
ncbi:MAG: hypothetical protein ACREGR_03510 [Minisyncoccia bacterium]